MIRYSFAFANGCHADFEVDEQAPSAPTPRSSEGQPDWMDLDTHRCAHCPFPRGKRVVCPAFDAIFPAVKTFDRCVSCETCDLTVDQNGVTHQAHTTAQNAVRSLIGLQLALSGCPTMNRLRPMARFHVPLSDADQTVFRVFGMHMLKQYLRQARGETPDWTLAGLQALYSDIHNVNGRLATRIRAASHEDASVNGLVILDALAHAVEHNIQTHLERLAPCFAPLDVSDNG